MLKKRIAFSFSLPVNCPTDGRHQARAGLCALCAEAACKVSVPCQNSKADCCCTMPPAASGRQLRALPQRCPFLFEVFAPSPASPCHGAVPLNSIPWLWPLKPSFWGGSADRASFMSRLPGPGDWCSDLASGSSSALSSLRVFHQLSAP